MGQLGHPDRPGLAVQARGLEARYRGRVALQGLDLDVAPGEILGVLGPNGAGKSSLLRLLCTGRAPSAGTLSLLGQPVFPRAGTVQLTALRRQIGIVPDESVHAEALTGRENAELLARAYGLDRATAHQRVAPLLAAWLIEHGERPVAEYSLGMRRRLNMVQALVHEPRLLILDEPTTGLDLQGRELARQYLRFRAGQTRAAVVLATNDVAELETLCDRVLFLYEGKPVLEGRPAELIARLGSWTRYAFTLRGTLVPAVVVDRVTIASASAERLVAYDQDGGSSLPALCAALLGSGCAIESVEVSRPSLADVFHEATGTPLSEVSRL